MKRIKKWYNRLPWRDKAIGGVSIIVVTLVVCLSLDWNIINPLIVVTALCVGVHFLLSASSQFLVGIVLVLHLGMLSLSLPIYGAFASTTSLGDSGGVYATLLISLVSLILTWLAYKFSVGRLWLTLFLTYIALDFIGLIVMGLLTVNNIFIGTFVAFIVLLSRCFVWRNLFKESKIILPQEIKNEKNTNSFKELVKNIDNVNIIDSSENPIDFIIEKGDSVYYINVITLKKQIAIFGNDIASDRYNLKSTLYVTALTAKLNNRAKKRKLRKNVVPCIVNFSDKDNSSVEVKVAIRGNRRNEGDSVLITSPSALIALLVK